MCTSRVPAVLAQRSEVLRWPIPMVDQTDWNSRSFRQSCLLFLRAGHIGLNNRSYSLSSLPIRLAAHIDYCSEWCSGLPKQVVAGRGPR